MLAAWGQLGEIEALAKESGHWADMARLWLGQTDEAQLAKASRDDPTLSQQDRLLLRGLFRFFSARAAERDGHLVTARHAYQQAVTDLASKAGVPERILARFCLEALSRDER